MFLYVLDQNKKSKNKKLLTFGFREIKSLELE